MNIRRRSSRWRTVSQYLIIGVLWLIHSLCLISLGIIRVIEGILLFWCGERSRPFLTTKHASCQCCGSCRVRQVVSKRSLHFHMTILQTIGMDVFFMRLWPLLLGVLSKAKSGTFTAIIGSCHGLLKHRSCGGLFQKSGVS